MRPGILPEAEIRFAAKTGFITKKIWNEFFAEGGDRWRRKHWSLLRGRGFFRPHRSSRASDVLVPNPKHKDVNRLLGSDITAPPFVAQLDHDELMARSLLRLSRAKVIAAYRTEGELKRLFPLARNRYIPDQKEKYPDAIIETVSGLSVALELEMTLKTRQRYRQALRTYRARSDVSRIVFIVRSAAAFDSKCLSGCLRMT